MKLAEDEGNIASAAPTVPTVLGSPGKVNRTK